jgi:hypothetical protein
MPKEAAPIFKSPLGVNNIDDPRAPAFQDSSVLTKAQNVDLDRNGFVRRRVGRTKFLDLTSAHSLYASGDRLFLVDSGTLYEVTPDYTLIPLDTGLGQAPVSYAEVAGQVFYANEAKVGVVGGFWGISTPSSPHCVVTVGNMPPGRYLVAVVAVRGGVESGARMPSVVELSAVGGLELHVAAVDLGVDALAVYCSEPNGQELYFQGEFATTSPIRLQHIGVSTDLLTTLGHYPPPPGQHIAAFRGLMLVASGSALYWSQPLAYHHFRVQTDVQLFPERIVLLAAFDAGFFVATASRTYWVAGQEPDGWQPQVVDTRRVAEGAALRIPAQKLPGLQSQGEVSVWATEDGFVAGLANGTIQHLTDGRLAVDAYKQAAFAFREEGGLRQILMSLQTKDSDTRFGATDRVTCRVIRANESTGEA